MPQRFKLLGVFASMYVAIGILALLGAGGLLIVFILTAYNGDNSIPWLTAPLVFGVVIGLALFGLQSAALGEFIRVVMKIEWNTRKDYES